MEDMTCPKCQSPMTSRVLGQVSVAQCSGCRGIFLEREDLGLLVEAETDWHRGLGGPVTEPLPRISLDMEAPPPSLAPKTRGFIETLFG